jgi:hypothetical protein
MEVGRFNSATLLTFKVTGIVNCAPPPVELSDTLPLYTPGARPVGFTPTVKVAGVVVPLAVPINNQLTLLAVPVLEIVKPRGVPPDATETVCAAGRVWPTW